jgi:hypothetical protein
MNTKGHIISDEQFREYETLKQEEIESKREIIISEIYYSYGDWVPHDTHKFEIKSDNTEVLDFITGKVNKIVTKNFDILCDYVYKQIYPLDERKRKLSTELSELYEKKRKLMQSPTIWEFLKQRKKFKI